MKSIRRISRVLYNFPNYKIEEITSKLRWRKKEKKKNKKKL